jgi:hypothetical protein
MIAGVFALAVIGAVYQAVATEIDQRAYPFPGEMVEMDGHRLHIDCVGQGSPTVILESGLGNMSGRLGKRAAGGREDHARVHIRPGGYRLE